MDITIISLYAPIGILQAQEKWVLTLLSPTWDPGLGDINVTGGQIKGFPANHLC